MGKENDASRLSRRQMVLGAGSLIPAAIVGRPAWSEPGRTGGASLGPVEAFSFDMLRAMARSVAASPFRPAEVVRPDILAKIDYDAHQKLRFRAEASLRLDRDQRFPVQLFHLGHYFREPVRVFIVDGGDAREVLYDTELFESPAGHPARGLPQNAGFAGFRVMTPGLNSDWLAFLGASYFRTSGPFNQYGLSARGLAIDTGLPTPEEFPRFTRFWLAAEGPRLTVYALLESPSVAGAYRISAERLTDARDIHRNPMEVECELFARRDIRRLGIAPFSSMFWYGEHSRRQATDWRPEIHDSDGLALWTGAGERIWRPLGNPPRVNTSTFADHDPRGFGLAQRDRDFVHYLDDGVFYERRPSVWVEPLDPWGPGAVHLLEIPTDDEVHDNIAAYWCPGEPFRAGERRRYRYRLTWLDDIPFPESLARATATWTGMGGRPGQKRPAGVRKLVIDWQGPVLAGLGRQDGVEVVVTLSRGSVSNAYCHPVVDQRARWRSLFDVGAEGGEPIDMRAFLRKDGRPLTETWLYQHFPGR
ncbi:MAG: glucan biosynthesis protein D [Hyphomicrobiaceae bacterium]|nr:glucan biosynthesis protein D [Hyphomicrobiaceae bacterium]